MIKIAQISKQIWTLLACCGGGGGAVMARLPPPPLVRASNKD